MHSFCWNTYNLSKSEQLRAEYHGSTCADPITGKPAVYYPSWKRRLWYMFSVVSMLPLLVLGVAIMTLSLNLNGYVKNTESPIYIEWLAAYAQPVRGCVLLSLVCLHVTRSSSREGCLQGTVPTSCGWFQHWPTL